MEMILDKDIRDFAGKEILDICANYLPIIKSIIDTDMYKLTMQMAFLQLFPNAISEHRFTNRGKQRFNQEFLDALKYQINYNFPKLALTDNELRYLKKNCPYLKDWYLVYLKNFRYDPKNINVSLDSENNLVIDYKGLMVDEILWEVPLMALISELYFKIIDKNWTMDGQIERARAKAWVLSEDGCVFTDFGTRRRRNFETQDLVVGEMKNYVGFVGTSNVYLSMKYGLVPKGTVAHEWFQSMQALEGIRNSNYYGMDNWVRVYAGDLGMALTDTLGTEQFLKNFNLRFAKLFDGVRHDSGDEFWYTDLIVNHYKSLKIDPMTKTIIFSNALTYKKAIEIKKYCKGKIKCAFGIGTHFTNDFEGSPALNIVIKLYAINGIFVVKLSDDKGKEIGDRDALRVTKWECFGTQLD
jgi:nicotinate phosphoribosyltransferase